MAGKNMTQNSYASKKTKIIFFLLKRLSRRWQKYDAKFRHLKYSKSIFFYLHSLKLFHHFISFNYHSTDSIFKFKLNQSTLFKQIKFNKPN